MTYQSMPLSFSQWGRDLSVRAVRSRSTSLSTREGVMRRRMPRRSYSTPRAVRRVAGPQSAWSLRRTPYWEQMWSNLATWSAHSRSDPAMKMKSST